MADRVEKQGATPRPRGWELDPEQARVVDDFHRLYSRSGVWWETYWFGRRVVKCPLDLWIYQELIHRLRPDLIVETGTYAGGSAAFLAFVLDTVGNGEVVSIDTKRQPRPEHARITYLQGSSTEPRIVEEVRSRANGTVMVLLDSDHTKDHVLAEMRAYAPLVSPGSYLIVEDTHVNGNPIAEGFGPGPAEAVEEFLSETDGFEVDRECEKFMLTFNPGGYLRRVGDGE